jgi:hypothetical protein
MKALKRVIDFIVIELHGSSHALPVFNSVGVTLGTNQTVLVLEFMLIHIIVALIASGLGI